MMIFRPIGDFFGFFLRPIFVMLLRKFIIPFYQEYLPLMQQMGHDLGTKIANLLTWILESPLLGGAAGQDKFVTAYAEKDMSGMVEGKVFDENLSLAMQESLIQNKGYWEKMFIEMGKVPDWVKNSLPDNPSIWKSWETYIDQQNNPATSANTNVTDMFGTFIPTIDTTTTSVKNFGISLDSIFFGKKPEGVTKGYDKTSGYTDVDLNKIPDYLGGTKDTSSASLDTSSSPAANNFYVEMNSNLIVNTPDDSTTEETIKTNQDDRDKEMKNWFKRRIANISDV